MDCGGGPRLGAEFSPQLWGLRSPSTQGDRAHADAKPPSFGCLAASLRAANFSRDWARRLAAAAEHRKNFAFLRPPDEVVEFFRSYFDTFAGIEIVHRIEQRARVGARRKQVQRLLNAVPLAERDQHHGAALLARHDHRLVVLHDAVEEFRQILGRFGIGGNLDQRSLLCCTIYRTNYRTTLASPSEMAAVGTFGG